MSACARVVVAPKLLEHEDEAKLHTSRERPALRRVVTQKLDGTGGHPIGFEIRAVAFFAQSPALDLARQK